MSNPPTLPASGPARPLVTVRHAEPSDFEAVHRIYLAPRAIWGTLRLPYASAESYRQRLAEPPTGSYNLVACVSGEVVGQLGLFTGSQPRRRHVAELGMAVRDDWQGQGVGSALLQAAVDLAERWLNVSRLELEVYTDNPAAIALYQKFGFEIEGTKRKMAFRDGAYVDGYCMARLRAGF